MTFAELAALARAAARVVHGSGVVPALSPLRVLRFARESRKASRGPALVIRLHALNTPDKPALVDGDLRLSYRELDGRVNQLAHALAGLGVGPGDRVAVMLKNRHEYLEAQWAIARLGALTVQVGYRLKAGEVGWMLENSRPAAFLFEADLAGVATEAAAGKPPILVAVGGPVAGARDYEAFLAPEDPDRPVALAGPTDTGGVMLYTSGTTGRPKGAARDFKKTFHPALVEFLSRVTFRHDDRHLVVCPLYHAAPPAFMALTYIFGGTCVLAGGHFDAEEVLALIAHERITTSFMVPTLLARLAELPASVRRKYDTSSLRWLTSGAAPLPTETARRVEQAFGPILYNFYGSTETGMVTLALPGEHTARPGTIGRALAGNAIRLLGDDGREVPLGQPGELYVKSSMLVAGYHDNREASDKARKDGYFSVGDVGHRDADGYYYLGDRKSDMVISGGVNIYPWEIEQRLYAHPGVLEAAVVGLPDPEWGESLAAFVVRRGDAAVDADELRQFCRAGLADYKCPRSFQFIDALPRNPTGKVVKRELRERRGS